MLDWFLLWVLSPMDRSNTLCNLELLSLYGFTADFPFLVDVALTKDWKDFACDDDSDSSSFPMWEIPYFFQVEWHCSWCKTGGVMKDSKVTELAGSKAGTTLRVERDPSNVVLFLAKDSVFCLSLSTNL